MVRLSIVTVPIWLCEQIDGSVGLTFTEKCWFDSVVIAKDCVSPITLGTWILQYPLEVMSETMSPELTNAPAAGLELMTSPIGTELEHTVDVVPTLRPAAPSTADAWFVVSPTRGGTVNCAFGANT